jgi:hypothetical protein
MRSFRLSMPLLFLLTPDDCALAVESAFKMLMALELCALARIL